MDINEYFTIFMVNYSVMLLTKIVRTKISGNVRDYYLNNKIEIKFGEYIELSIDLLNPNSHLIVDVVCDVCGKENKIQYRRYLQSFNRGGFYSCSSKCGSSKRKKTCLEKYGFENYLETEIFKDKNKQTCIKKWGSDHFRKSEKWKIEGNSNNEIIKRKKTIFDQFLIENPNVVGQDDDNFIIKCDVHGETPIPKGLFSNRKIIKTEVCPVCNPIDYNISGKEVLLCKMIGEVYDGEIITSYKISRKEIDVYLPELKIGFEFNGLRWHSELFLENDYHIKKTRLCDDNGIRLIHIFEDDFDYKNEIIKSIITNIIGYSKKIYARKTKVVKITNKLIVKDFLNKNHLQGFVNTNINYGLYHNNELVSIMTFMRCRKVLNKKNTNHEYELVRFCNKVGFSVIGGASKLFNKFIDEYSPMSVLSYCDISWANGGLYRKLGFNSIGFTKPNYYYVIDKKRENRINYQKHKLVKKGYDDKLTEVEIMFNLGYYRIFNCGNEKFLYVKTQTN